MIGSSSASPADLAETLASSGRYREGVEVLTRAAASGDGDALFRMAEWRIDGSVVRRDLASARSLLARAALAGHQAAALHHAYFMASGVGGAEDWGSALSELQKLLHCDERAALQMRLLRQMAIDADGRPTRAPLRRLLCQDPLVVACPDFLSPGECEYIRLQAEPRLEPSLVVHPTTGMLIPHPIRRSHGAAFGVFDEDLVIRAINNRIATCSETATWQGEPLQVLKYFTGGEFRAHQDATPGADNHRIATVLLYLNEGYEGGETRFLRTGITFKGRIGDALLFRNLDERGRPHPLAEHAGLPVIRGEKIIASRWIRETRLVFPAPTPAVLV